MIDEERAPAYLLGLQDELDAMGRFPHSILQAGVLLALGAVFIVPSLIGGFAGEVAASFPWFLVGMLFAGPGIRYVLQTIEWYRHRRKLRYGIELIHNRQLERLEGRERVGP